MDGREAADRWCHAAQEGLLLILVVIAPWAFAAAEPQHHAALLGGVAVFTLLSAARVVLWRGPLWRPCAFAALLGALFVFTALQLVPLPPAVLGIVSPKSLELYRDLLPAEPEMLRGETTPLAAASDVWRPISLYPFATRSLLVDLLALFVVAAAVRQQLANPASMRRLAWVALANGSALSVFALAQMLGTPQKSAVYWSIPTKGAPFGPFINRDHFPFYVTMCMGLAATLLSDPIETGRRRRGPQPELTLQSILNDPRHLWVGGGMALMLVACFFSMSRGAVLAMAGSTLVVAALAWGTRSGAAWRPSALALAGGVALVIALWIGTIPVESRLATLGEKEALWEGRLSMWHATLPHLRDFPLFGSGGGTFEFVEPRYETKPRAEQLIISQFAHNEYLEAMFEGGIVRLLLTLALAAAPCWLAWRKLRGGTSISRVLILGPLWGLLVVALHSAFDFGIHMPAVALLAVVTAAQFSAITSKRDSVAESGNGTMRWAVAALGVPVGVLLGWEAATWALAEQYRKVALAMGQQPRVEDRESARRYWDAAIRLRPRDAVLHQSVGQAHLDLYSEGGAAHLAPAVRHLVAARDLCPVLAHPHARLGELAPLLARADAPVRYFERATRLLPTETEAWYGLGGAYLDAGRTEEAQAAWRRYLTGHDRLRVKVLDRAVAAWGEQSVRERVLPDRPEVWLAAAQHLYPKEEQREQRRPFVEGALALMEREPAKPELSYRKAKLQRELKAEDAAIASYRDALRQAPGNLDWRFELAQLLHDRDLFKESRSELQTILARRPDHQAAKDLLQVVEREIKLREP